MVCVTDMGIRTKAIYSTYSAYLGKLVLFKMVIVHSYVKFAEG